MESIPGFQDTGLIQGRTVNFARKAQLLVADLYCRFADAQPLFRFVDMVDIGPDSGAYAVATARAHGCITCRGSLAQALSDGVLPAGAYERALRAACIVASCRVAEALGVAAWQLSRWMQVQTDNQRDSGPLLCTRSTVAY
jgi:Potential Queuosine, Q, salvage protein family